MATSAQLTRRLRVFVVEDRNFILADGHERAVQRFYLYRDIFRKAKVTLGIWVWTGRSG